MSEPARADHNADISNSVGNFAELVASGTPTPGGGSVAAYCGVLAASLGQMVCNLTIGKQKYADSEPRLVEIKAQLEQLSSRLRELIAEDAASFEAVLSAYRLPKATDLQKAERGAQIQIALGGAVAVPLETAQRGFEVSRLLRELAKIGNPNALSDVAVGTQLAQVAVSGASFNISVNLDSIADLESADKTREQVKMMSEQSKTIADEVEAKLKM
jgi:formiminotetrahydrofolate cyclodeaminase